MPRLPTRLRECSYELYRAVYLAIRQGIAKGDDHIVDRVSLQMVARDSATCLIMTLALIEAKNGVPERHKENVCNVLCAARCTDAAMVRREGG
jgi:hypothetical protein